MTVLATVSRASKGIGLFLSVADDAVAVADALGWDRFSILGISGGGPHALVIGVRAPERILALGLAVGTTPTELVHPDDLIPINREGKRRALGLACRLVCFRRLRSSI